MARAREKLKAAPRAEFGSRTTRRLRREGLVPGVVYSGGSEARPFQVAEREVRNVLAGGQALFDLEIEGGESRSRSWSRSSSCTRSAATSSTSTCRR